MKMTPRISLSRFSPLHALFVALALTLGACKGSGETHAANVDVAAVQEDSVVTRSNDKAVLYFVGDAMQHGKQISRAELLGKGDFDYSTCFELIEPTIQAADYAVVNLETPLGGGRGGYTGFPRFSAPDAYARQLKKVGFDLFLTANNHMLDRDDYGLRRTLAVLDTLGVDYIGTYNNVTERTEKVPFIKTINGIKFAFLNYTYGTNGIRAKEGAEVAYINDKKMKEEIALAKKAGAEMIVVAIHWGVEYVLNENAEQRRVAQLLLDNGVDMVIGGHPHVVQPMRMVDNPSTGKKSLVVYSLGNFISNMDKPDTRGGASVTAVVERDAEGNPQITDVAYDTFFVEKPTGPNTNFRVIPYSQSDLIPASQSNQWTIFNKNSQALFDKQNKDVTRIKTASER